MRRGVVMVSGVAWFGGAARVRGTCWDRTVVARVMRERRTVVERILDVSCALWSGCAMTFG